MKLKPVLVGLMGLGCLLAMFRPAAAQAAVALEEAARQGKVEVEVTGPGGATGETPRVSVRCKVPETLHIEIETAGEGSPEAAPEAEEGPDGDSRAPSTVVSVLAGAAGTSVEVRTADLAEVASAIRSIRQARNAARLKHPNPRIRQRAAGILGSLKDPRAVDALIEALSDPDRKVRRAAAGALEAISGEDLGSDPADWRRWQQASPQPAEQQ